MIFMYLLHLVKYIKVIFRSSSMLLYVLKNDPPLFHTGSHTDNLTLVLGWHLGSPDNETKVLPSVLRTEKVKLHPE